MGTSAFYVLAIAACGIFGALGVLLGLYMGVRMVERDEDRYPAVLKALEAAQQDFSKLRLEWGSTLEALEDLATNVERARRRAAASLSAQERKEGLLQEPPAPPPTVQQQRDEARRRLRSVG